MQNLPKFQKWFIFIIVMIALAFATPVLANYRDRTAL
jgi:hypothetical protein